MGGGIGASDFKHTAGNRHQPTHRNADIEGRPTPDERPGKGVTFKALAAQREDQLRRMNEALVARQHPMGALADHETVTPIQRAIQKAAAAAAEISELKASGDAHKGVKEKKNEQLHIMRDLVLKAAQTYAEYLPDSLLDEFGVSFDER